MQVPSYIFKDEFKKFKDYFLSQPHNNVTFKKGEFVWRENECLTKVYFVLDGLIQMSCLHEDGYQKIISYYGSNSIFPGCSSTKFKLEQSLIATAVSDVSTLCFPQETFYQMYLHYEELTAAVLESYAKQVNLLLYQSAHQDYNGTASKICNLLYLLLKFNSEDNRIDITQEELAQMLSINRVNVSKNLSRLRELHILETSRHHIKILDTDALIQMCTAETID